MKAARLSAAVLVFLVFVCMPAAPSAADDIPGLLEKKGPGAKDIVAKPTIFRESRIPHLPISARQFEFLVDHPKTALALAHLYAPFLDAYRVEIGPDRMIHIHDPGKLAGDAELVDARPGRRIYLISGYFDVFKIRFSGQMVLMTVYRESRESGAVSVDSTTSGSIRVKSSFAGAFARLADYLFPRKVDGRIERFLDAAKSIARAVHDDPADVCRKLAASGELTPEELGDFVQVFGAESQHAREAGMP